MAITEGQPGERQDPLPEIDGTAHPKVRINVDGSKFDFNAEEEPELCAGTAVLIHAHPGKQFWHSPPLAIHRERTVGTQSCQRAELRGIYLGLRACRDVPYIHLQSDSEYALMQINRFWREGCQNCLQTTAHRDLICSTVKELQLRDRRHGKGHLWLEKVASHDDELTHDEPTTSPQSSGECYGGPVF